MTMAERSPMQLLVGPSCVPIMHTVKARLRNQSFTQKKSHDQPHTNVGLFCTRENTQNSPHHEYKYIINNNETSPSHPHHFGRSVMLRRVRNFSCSLLASIHQSTNGLRFKKNTMSTSGREFQTTPKGMRIRSSPIHEGFSS